MLDQDKMNCMTLIAGKKPAQQGVCLSVIMRTTAAMSSFVTAGFPRRTGRQEA